MKHKGIIFSLAMLFLISSFILLYQSTIKGSPLQQQTSRTIAAYQSLSSHYENLSRTIVELDTKSSFGQTQQRILPFNFNADENTLSLEFNLPIRQATLERYFDTINAFRIFVQDKNYSNYYYGIGTAAQTVKNSAWGGTSTELNFVEEPSCMKITAQSTGIMLSRGWCADFNMSKAARIDTNITINTPGEDLDSISCQWNATPLCPNDTFNPANPNPFFTLQVFDQNCAGCNFSTTTVSGHFDPLQENWVTIYCQAPNCSSYKIDLNVSSTFRIGRDNAALPAHASTGIVLKERVKKIYFDDLNISISSDDFNLNVETPR